MPALEGAPRYPSAVRGPLGESNNNHAGRMPSQSHSKIPGSLGLMGKRVVTGGQRVASSSSVSNHRDENDEEEWDDSRNSGQPRKPSAAGRPRHSLNNRLLQQRVVSRPAEASSSSEASLPSSGAPVPSSSRMVSSSRSGMSTLARANANARRVSMGPPGGLSGGADAINPVKKLTVDSTSFDEWMKMATDNKINPTNTFSIALIDYFHDMSLLRSDSGDGSINFQKASCTLDGCVKVWTSRVDSVVTETGKLLNGLVGDGKGAAEDGDMDGELEFDEDGNPIGVSGKKDKKKRTRAKEATLVKNFSAIAVKKLDLEYTVDPLFKKTSADFDEGGAGGLLMNHLGVDDKMRVVFDAGEAPGLPPDQPEGQEHGEEDEENETTTPQPSGPSDLVDLTRLKAKLFSQAPADLLERSLDPLSELLQDRMVCPSLAHFSFSQDQEGALFGQELYDSDDEDGGRRANAWDLGPMNPAVAATPWGGADGGFNDFDGGVSPSGEAFDEDDESGADLFGVPTELDARPDIFGLPAEPMSQPYSQHQQVFDQGEEGMDLLDGGDMPDFGNGEDGADGAPVHWNPRHGPSQHDLMLAFKGISGNDDEGQQGEGSSAQPGGGLFDYFDQRLMKSWAGPEHWKMRSRLAGFIKEQQSGQQRADGQEGDEGQSKKKKAPKEAFVIDFTGDEGAVSAKELFEAPRSSVSTLLPKTRHQPETFLLPDDRHFTSKRLLRLFIKPRAILNIRTRRGGLRFGGPNVPGFGAAADGELDGDFWAAQQAAREADGLDGFDAGVGLDGDFGGDAMPLNTQFYHDGDDEGAFELASSMPAHQGQADPNSAADVDVADFEEDELAAQAAALKRVKPEYVNYAKKAKRVDIRKLKENIWKQLSLGGMVAQEEANDKLESESEADSTVATPQAITPPRASKVTLSEPADSTKTFRSILSGLRESYPKEKMEEISTSFCFICLLHLANEEGLEIKIGQDQGPGARDLIRKNNGAFMTPGRVLLNRPPVDSDEEGEDGKQRSLMGLDDEDDDEDGPEVEGEEGEEEEEEEEEDADWKALSVGRLEYLRIKKDPKAGRSA